MKKIDMPLSKKQEFINKFMKFIFGIIIAGAFVGSLAIILAVLSHPAADSAPLPQNPNQYAIDSVNAENDALRREIQAFNNLIDSNRRLYQHFVAAKYSALPPTYDNVRAFCEEAGCINPIVNAGVARKETAFKLGTAKYCNLHGFKRAKKRFTWAEGIATQNNAKYAAWPYSCLDFDEYLRSGAKNWSSH